jgi:predicted nucleic acid-binding protein
LIACLDTDVLIDCWRGVPAARAWLSGASEVEAMIPGIVAMEMVAGCRNAREVQEVDRFLADFAVEWPESSEIANAYVLLAKYRPSTGLAIPDSIVASMAMSRSARLYTFNTRHYATIDGLDVALPYARSGS